MTHSSEVIQKAKDKSRAHFAGRKAAFSAQLAQAKEQASGNTETMPVDEFLERLFDDPEQADKEKV